MPSSAIRRAILKSIEKLKKRKIRPDLEEIFHMVLRKHEVGKDQLSEALENLVKENKIERVPHPSGPSYRVRPKLTNGWGHFDSSTDKDSDSSVDNFSDVDDDDDAATLNSDEETVDGRDSSEKAIREEDSVRSASTGTTGSTPEKYAHKAGKKKRLSDGDHVQIKKRRVEVTTSSADVDDLDRCDFCLKIPERDAYGQPINFLFCKDCKAKAHPSCMEYSDALAQRAMQSPWQCIDCKTCYICGDAEDPDEMLFCDSCDKGYHMSCNTPVIKVKPTGLWECDKCKQEKGEQQESSAANIEAAPTTTTTSPTPEVTNYQTIYKPVQLPIYLKELPTIRPWLECEVPDATNWSIQDVGQFLVKAGFPDEAKVFEKEEIDGASLLLLKRSDVLQNMPILLGPALKIYTIIQILQTKGNYSLL